MKKWKTQRTIFACTLRNYNNKNGQMNENGGTAERKQFYERQRET